MDALPAGYVAPDLICTAASHSFALGSIVEGIVGYLTPSEVGRLRLVCRELGAKAACGDYAGNFHSRTVLWNVPDSVDNFTRLVTPLNSGLIASKLEKVTVAGRCTHTLVAHDQEEFLDARSNALQQLASALCRLWDERGTRHNLSLGLAIYDTRPESPYVPMPYNYSRTYRGGIGPNDWRPKWTSAAETFNFAVDTLALSRCPIVGLDVFSCELECALGIDQLGAFLHRESFSTSVSGLRDLSLRLSQSFLPMGSRLASGKSNNVNHRSQDSSGVEESSSPSEESSEAENALPSKFTTSHGTKIPDTAFYVRDLLDLCPLLRSLDIHWYKLKPSSALNDIERRQSRFFNRLKTLRLVHLQSVNLAGLECQASALYAFAQNHCQTLHSLKLDSVTLYRGRFLHFFNCVQSQMPQLRSFEFDNLYERHHPICFLVQGQPNSRSTDRSDGPNRLQRVGQDVRLAIEYRRMKGENMGCPQLYQFLWSLRRKYGPPLAA